MKIVPISLDLLPDFPAYLQECVDAGIEHYTDALKDPEASLRRNIDIAQGKNLPDGWCPQETYFAVKNQRLLGAIRLRRGDGHFIQNEIGHIGYEVRPKEQGRGIAKHLLQYIVDHQLTSPALVVCDADNIASARVAQTIAGTEGERQGEQLRFRLAP
ncbi:GNAT family N-acetyltransferase [Salinibius halmophilus]|uniref:GNAT family N-acetyltransferase n=1 Tax=Salinibius halmophilus TaxID=1853216 RepID=UPI000E6671DA|nr:GNAT family N-acetyltransferase [Salinibius halmophilus]